MTVIAYSSRHRVLAADSRISDDDGTLVTRGRKIFRLRNGALLGSAGESDTRDLCDVLGRVSHRSLPSRRALADLRLACSGLVIFPAGRVFIFEIEQRKSEGGETQEEWWSNVDEVRDPFAAVGTGAKFALGAMEVGADPVQAVRAACRRDPWCSTPVKWVKLK